MAHVANKEERKKEAGEHLQIEL